MKEKSKIFKDVTLLITHYNRSQSLERLLEEFSKTNTSFYEIIVSDDGSKSEHLNYIETLKNKYDFKLVKAIRNSGLGNNINKGQDAVSTEYTLYVQEDFIPLASFDEHFENGLNILKDDRSLDTVRFYSYLDYPKIRSYGKGFSEMVFKPLGRDIDKVPLYSDHPHLKRSNFFEKFGRYSENKNPEKTEYDMMISFLRNGGRGLLFNDYKTVFEQINTAVEPSTMTRKFWRNSNNIALTSLMSVYRHVLFLYSFYLKK